MFDTPRIESRNEPGTSSLLVAYPLPFFDRLKTSVDREVHSSIHADASVGAPTAQRVGVVCLRCRKLYLDSIGALGGN